MNYQELTSPCGRDCFNCPFYLANKSEAMKKGLAKKFQMAEENIPCSGCRSIEGKCELLKQMGLGEPCKIYTCSQKEGVEFCYQCKKFPCELLHPLADHAGDLPHNLKVYNLCKIQQMGVEEWAEKEAKKSFDKYFTGKL